MKKMMMICLWAVASVLTVSAQTSVYDFKVKDDTGKDMALSDYKGKVLLIVNTATRCGFTPQYKELVGRPAGAPVPQVVHYRQNP